MSDFIKGLWVALATPLGRDGAVDATEMARHAKALLTDGCDGIVLFGTTGEGTSFSTAERLATTEAMLKAGITADQLALGTGFPAITETIAATRGARALGLTHVLTLPPYFYRDASEDGIADAFSTILDTLADPGLRMTLYHIPQVSGVGVAPAVAAKLRTRFGKVLAGLKDSTGEFVNFRAFRAAVPDLPILVGNEADIGRAVAEGGAGTICGMANLVPGLVRAMFSEAGAEARMRAALSLIKGEFLPSIKSALAAQSGHAEWRLVRPPLSAESAALGQEILRGVAELKAGRAA